jgi:hypothetical protein
MMFTLFIGGIRKGDENPILFRDNRLGNSTMSLLHSPEHRGSPHLCFLVRPAGCTHLRVKVPYHDRALKPSRVLETRELQIVLGLVAWS